MTFLPNWRTIGLLASALLITLSLACVGGGSNPPPPPPPEGSLRVYNGGNLEMWNLHVTPSASSSWGVDQLAPNTLIPGDSLTLSRLYPDSYDVEAQFSDGSFDRVYDVRIQDGLTTTVTMMDTGNGAVAVFNNSGLTIFQIYLTPTTYSTWGPNQADQPLYDLQTLTLSGVSPGTYDLKVVFSSGTAVYPPSFSVTSGTVTTIQVN
jgi:hypothetical protein